MKPDRGALALVLHSHMPYVEGFGTWPFGEEWLWEAVATVYLPLLDLLEETGAPVTLGLTPVLCDQLETLPGPAGERLLGFLRETRRLVHEEDSAGLERTGHPELGAEVRRSGGDYVRAAETLERDGRDLLARIAALGSGGPVELWTSSATHALLPLMASNEGRACSWPPVSPRTSGASAPSAGGSGCPSAPTCPASSASWPTTACAPRASTRPPCTATARPSTWSRCSHRAG